jgi:hypothetical protein
MDYGHLDSTNAFRKTHLRLAEAVLPILVTRVGRAKRWTVLVSTHETSGCAVDPSCSPLKGGPDRRAQTLSGRASMIGLPAQRMKKSCHGTCGILPYLFFGRKVAVTYSLHTEISAVVSD